MMTMLMLAVTLIAGNYEIVIPAKPNQTESFAAEEARKFLGSALGAESPSGKVKILLGRAAGIDVSGFVRDEFVIRTDGDSIRIAGRDAGVNPVTTPSPLFERGTLHALYTFLEDYVGCRFYFPGELGEVVPKHGKLELGAINVHRTPDFLQREWYSKDGEWYDRTVDAKEAARGKRLHMLRTRGGTVKVPCCHGTIHMKFLDRFGKTHPEYFALRSDGSRCVNYTGTRSSSYGQLCFSSGIRDEIVEYCVAKAKEGKKYFDIMPNDAMPRCHCEKCRATYDDSKPCYASRLIWEYTAYVAKKLQERGVPGYVTQMAYAQYRTIPEDVEIPTNVLVMVAETGPWSMNNPAKVKAEYDEIRAWRKKSGNPIWIWTYPHKYPPMNVLGFCDFAPRAWGRYYQALKGDIFGTFAESEGDRWINHHLNYYVFQKVLWDASLDVDALVAEYYRLMFGKGEKPMAEFFDMLEAKWTKELVGRIVDTPAGPVCEPPLEADIWEKTYGTEAIARLDGCLKAAKESVAADSIEARRIDFMRTQFLGPMEEGAAKYAEKRAKVAALRWEPAKGPLAALSPYKVKKEPAEYVRTAVSMTRDRTNLVVTFDCEDNRMDEIADIVRKPDDPETWRDNGIELFLNPNGDRRTYYHFIVNSRGSLSDYRGEKVSMRPWKSSKGGEQTAWNSGAKTAVERRADGWKVMLTIPIASFREPLADEFPAEFVRNRYTKSGNGHCLYHWSPYAFGFNDVPEYGTVVLPK